MIKQAPIAHRSFCRRAPPVIALRAEANEHARFVMFL
jgi:hypothetical protein